MAYTTIVICYLILNVRVCSFQREYMYTYLNKYEKWEMKWSEHLQYTNVGMEYNLILSEYNICEQAARGHQTSSLLMGPNEKSNASHFELERKRERENWKNAEISISL